MIPEPVLVAERASPTLPRVSVVMAYYQRAQQFGMTLASFALHYPDLPFEIVAVDDSSADANEMPNLLREASFAFRAYRVDRSNKPTRSAGPPYNFASQQARAPLLVIQNPECLHLGPVLRNAIEHYSTGSWRAYACMTLGQPVMDLGAFLEHPDHWQNTNDGAQGWYQHSMYCPRYLHFCCAIDAPTWAAHGGFDEEFDDGWAFEDTELILRLRERGVPLIAVDSPIVAHQQHERTHYQSQPDFHEGWRRNHALCQAKHPGQWFD